MKMGGHGHTPPWPWGSIGYMEVSDKRMHGLYDMQVAFSLCQHNGMTKTREYGWKAMCAMPWLGCLGRSSNGALLRTEHGLRAGHVKKASLP